jgi:hypothetical protein
MYKVTNLKRAPTPLPLPGRSVILAKIGHSANIRDREAEEGIIQSFAKSGRISLEKLDDPDPVEDVDSRDYQEYKRITAVRSAQDRAARRARGELV